MTRSDTIAGALAWFDSGAFLRDLDRRVAFHTESQEPDQAPALAAYLDDEMTPTLARLGFASRIVPNPFLQTIALDDSLKLSLTAAQTARLTALSDSLKPRN